MNRFVALAFVSLLAACEPPPPPVPGEIQPGGTVLATVNGKGVTQEMLDATFKALPDRVRAQLEKSGDMGQVKEQLVISELLYQEALKAKVQDQAEMKLTLALAERNALAESFLNKVMKERMTDQVLQTWYEDHKVQFARPQRKLAQIAVETEADAQAIVAAVEGGANFGELAREKSKDRTSAAEGGSLGWFSQKDLREPLASTAFATEKGKTAAPIQTPAGWIVLYVEDARDQVPFEEVRDYIEGQARGDVVRKYIDELKKGATIVDAPAAGAPGAPAAGGPPPMVPVEAGGSPKPEGSAVPAGSTPAEGTH